MSNWIKLRTKLKDDGRVMVVSRLCNASTVTVFGAIVTLWCYADDHADENGVMYGWDAEEVDRRVGVPGFAKALPSDWIDLSGEWVKLPNYQEHNGSTGKSRAQSASRQKRHRRNATVTQAPLREALPEKRREEKKREEYNNNPLTPLQGEPLKTTKRKKPVDVFFGLTVPETLEVSLAEWVEYRRQAKKPLTKLGLQKIITKYQDEPDKLSMSVNCSIENGWQGLFESSTQGHTGPLNGTQTLHSSAQKVSNSQHNFNLAKKLIEEELEKERQWTEKR